jgi:hypothetical protein
MTTELTHVEYRGERIALRHGYRDFKDYKNDANNLSEETVPRIESLVRTAPFGPVFPNATAVDRALDELRFPGYGSFYANQLGAKLDPTLELVYVEIPSRKLNRYLALEQQSDGRLVVVADFVTGSSPEIVRVHRVGGYLQFLTLKGQSVPVQNMP